LTSTASLGMAGSFEAENDRSIRLGQLYVLKKYNRYGLRDRLNPHPPHPT